MSEPNRRPGGMWTFSVLSGGLVLYILSAGPMAWVMGRCGFPDYLLVPFEVIYKPVEMVEERLPLAIRKPYDQYIHWWIAPYLPPPVSPGAPVPPIAAPAPESVEEALPAEVMDRAPQAE